MRRPIETYIISLLSPIITHPKPFLKFPLSKSSYPLEMGSKPQTELVDRKIRF